MGIAKLGHLELRTPDLSDSVWFFRDVIGLKETERADGRVYLRGVRDWEHHTLTLRRGDETAVDHVAWRTEAPSDVPTLADRLDAPGRTVSRVDAGVEAGQGDAVRIQTALGHVAEFYYDVEKPAAPAAERSRLHNRRHGPQSMNRVAPRRIDHVHLQDPDGTALTALYRDELDFEVRERYVTDDGPWGWWLSRTALPHDVAVHHEPAMDAGRVHHLCFHVDRLSELWDAADLCREHGIAPEAGPGKHAITKADYLYLLDPGSGFRVELFAGPGYLNFEPDWEPIEWHEEGIGDEPDHQWFGTQFGPEATPYVD